MIDDWFSTIELLGLVLLGKSPSILCVAITSLKHELADPGAWILSQWCMAEIYHLQDLVVECPGA